MARQFGGKYSPDDVETPGSASGSGPEKARERGAYEGAHPEPAGARINLLFIPAIPLVFLAFNDGAIGLALALVAAGLLTGAAWLTREGVRAQAAYDARRVARRPALPRKLVGSLLTGLGIAVAAFQTQGAWADPGGANIAAALLYGGLAAVLHGIAFGLDPLKDKGMEGIDTFQQDRVARVVDEAEAYLFAMSDAVARASDPGAEARVERFQATARELFRTVEEDPRDLSAARRYLTVYLRGARDATIRFADIHTRTGDRQARADYIALLDDLEQNFAARTHALLLDDRADLTIEIEVLRERLQREGVTSD